MDFSRTGGMSQVFVINALTEHAQRVVDNTDKLREEWANSFINPESYIAAAKEWLASEPKS